MLDFQLKREYHSAVWQHWLFFFSFSFSFFPFFISFLYFFPSFFFLPPLTSPPLFSFPFSRWFYAYIVATFYAGYLLLALFSFFSLQCVLSSTGLTEKDVFGSYFLFFSFSLFSLLLFLFFLLIYFFPFFFSSIQPPPLSPLPLSPPLSPPQQEKENPQPPPKSKIVSLISHNCVAQH